MSTLTPATGRPRVSWTVHTASIGSPAGSVVMELPFGSTGASCVWKGPSTEPSVPSGGLGWLMLSTRSERPRTSERRMNSCGAATGG